MEPTKRPKRVTITDVAARAGVSTAAVSKVLRNAYGVSPAMQERVRAAMAELDYRPHAAARGMRGRTYTIGVLLDSLRNTFFADILDGVQQQLSGSDWKLTPEAVLAKGYTAAMKRHGLAPQALAAAYSEEGGYEAGKRLLSAADRPTAIMAGADVAALGVYRAAAELGLDIPGDLSLVGYNNTAIAALAPVQ